MLEITNPHNTKMGVSLLSRAFAFPLLNSKSALLLPYPRHDDRTSPISTFHSKYKCSFVVRSRFDLGGGGCSSTFEPLMYRIDTVVE